MVEQQILEYACVSLTTCVSPPFILDGPGDANGQILEHLHQLVHKLEALIRQTQAGLCGQPGPAIEETLSTLNPPAGAPAGGTAQAPPPSPGQMTNPFASPMETHHQVISFERRLYRIKTPRPTHTRF